LTFENQTAKLEVIRKNLKHERKLNMKVIGYQFTSSTSSNRKQYTLLVTEDGGVIRHYGGRKNNRGTFVSGPGSVTVGSTPMTPAQLTGFLQTELQDKMDKSEYDGVTIEFTGLDTARITPNMTDTMLKSVARTVAEEWLSAVRMNFPQDSDNPKTNANINFTARKADIQAFAQRQARGTGSIQQANKTTAAAKSATAKVKVRTYFTEIEEFAQGQKVLRPNGEEYRPREIMGHTDVALMRKFRAINMNFRLAGPPGAGKTASVEAAFGTDLITVSGHGDMTVANLVGTHLPLPDGTWKWQDGPLTKAMKEGRPFFVDECNRIPVEVLNILFSAMDGRGMIRLDDRPDDPIVYAAKGFFVCMGYNPNTIGARQLDEALVSRFRVQIDVYTDHATAKALGVPAVALRIAANLKTKDEKDRAAGGPGFYTPQMRELLTFRDIVKEGLGEDFALATLVASCPNPMDMPTLVDTIKSVAKIDSIGVPTLGSLV
jgi:hypothetical protein